MFTDEIALRNAGKSGDDIACWAGDDGNEGCGCSIAFVADDGAGVFGAVIV